MNDDEPPPDRPTGDSDRLSEQETLAGSLTSDPSGRGTSFEAGTVLGRYRLDELLGAGGFGQVWKAEHLDDGRVLALKILTKLHAEPGETLERFQREGRIAASINHPNSVYVFGADQLDGYPVIAQELMVGGTLADQLAERTRLPAAEAVDRILEIIDGLEAAQKIGVLHRDIKPSNCFIDENGEAKIGDYGLSKSLVVDSDLTKTASFLGTPVYSSPEQVRGREIDVRSDIYSLGATLYTLLAGEPPFGAGNAGEVLARILSEPPTPFAEHSIEMPRGLDKVVMQCLRKEPDKRFKDYAALRQALLSYSTDASTAGNMLRRVVAYAIDTAVLGLVFISIPALGGPLLPAWNWLNLLIGALYFFVAEWRWGAGVGKYLLGLRVTSQEGPPADPLPVLARTAVWYLLLAGATPIWLKLRGLPPLSYGGASPETLLVSTVGVVLIVSTMRWRNGFAGLHEVVSGTRVRALRRRTRLAVPYLDLLIAKPIDSQRLGPFAVRGEIWRTESEALLVGFDEHLQRDVWIHTRRGDQQQPSTDQLSRTRPGNLRWLQGAADAEGRWDAYEAPTGAGLYDWFFRKGRLGWGQMRHVVKTLADELDERFAAGDRVASTSLRQIWVDGNGHVKLMDFPTDPEDPGWDAPEEVRPDNWKGFMRRVIHFGTMGARDTGGPPPMPPHTPLPEHAREFLAAHLGGDRGTPSEGTADGAKALKLFRTEITGLVQRRATVTRARRAAFYGAMIGPYAAVQALFLLGFLFVYMTMSESFFLANGYDTMLERTVGELANPELVPEDRAVLEQRREALRQILAFNWKDAREAPLLQGLSGANFNIGDERAESALRDYPAVTQEEVDHLIEEHGVRRLRGPGTQRFVTGAAIGALTVGIVFYFGIASVIGPIFALALRGSLLFSAFGLTLQTLDGERASRMKCLQRALLAWAPFLIAGPLRLVIEVHVVVTVSMIALAGAGAVYALRSPERGIPDEIVGTQLVAR